MADTSEEVVACVSGPFVYHYTRYFCPGTEAYDTLEEALFRAWYDFAYGEAYGREITRHGRVVYDHAALFADWGLRDDATGAYKGAADCPAPPAPAGGPA